MSPVDPPRLLVANRGEIALRLIRGARDEGWRSIAVFSEADRFAPHVGLADEAYCIGPAPSNESYLRIPNLLEAARLGRATHVHPGYGFLSENPALPDACTEAGLGFIGPPAAAMRAMGDKVSARAAAERAGVPVLPGSPPLPDDVDLALRAAEQIGYPVLLKAAFGGGGKGMRLCATPEEVRKNLVLTRGEAARAFGNDAIFLERAVVNPRHIEIQLLCDRQGAAIHLGERECSIQRRHQKLIEEAPSPILDAATRDAMGQAAVRLALAIGYENAGTCEFLLASDGRFYFLEMNTRLQVEHPVTELVTGIDLVRAQLRIALGQPLPWRQEEIVTRGAAIEVRLCAEDPLRQFAPASGTITYARLPQGPGVRNDAAVETGSEVPVHYDSMLGKLIAWGATREEARTRLVRALDECVIEGVATNLPFQRWALRHPAFIAGALHTGFVEEHFRPEALLHPDDSELTSILAVIAAWRERERPATMERARVVGSSPSGSAWRRAHGWKNRG